MKQLARTLTLAFIGRRPITDGLNPPMKIEQVEIHRHSPIHRHPHIYRHPHVLNASTSLLGICFIVIGGLKFSHFNIKTYSDEIAWIAATLFFGSVTMSYFGIRNGGAKNWQLVVADWVFMGGLVALMASVFIAAIDLSG